MKYNEINNLKKYDVIKEKYGSLWCKTEMVRWKKSKTKPKTLFAFHAEMLF